MSNLTEFTNLVKNGVTLDRPWMVIFVILFCNLSTASRTLNLTIKIRLYEVHYIPIVAILFIRVCPNACKKVGGKHFEAAKR